MPLPTRDEIYNAMKTIQDPEIQIGIVDLGLIYDVNIEDDGKVQVKMTLTTPACPYGDMLLSMVHACPYGDMLLSMVHRSIGQMEGITGVEVVLVWDPVWDPKEMASDSAKDMLGIW